MGPAMSRSPSPDPADIAPPAPAGTGDEGVRTSDQVVVEIGGRGGLDPTRYGDWEKNGRCIDF